MSQQNKDDVGNNQTDGSPAVEEPGADSSAETVAEGSATVEDCFHTG